MPDSSIPTGFYQVPLRFAFPDESFPLSVSFWDDALPIRNHVHSFYELVIVFHGSAVHRVGGRNILLERGDVFVIPPRLPHSYIDCRNFGYCNVMVNHEELPLLSTILLPEKMPRYKWLFGEMPRHFYVGDEPRLRIGEAVLADCNRILERMLREQTMAEPGCRIAMAAAYLELLLCLCRENPSSLRDGMIPELFRSLSGEIIRTSAKPLDMDKLCRSAGISRATLFRGFRRYYRMTPLGFQLQCRLRHAQQLLAHQTQPIGEIAARCGFSTQSYFSEIFRRHFGMTPLEFRNSRRFEE